MSKVMKFTLVEHPAYVLGGDATYKNFVDIAQLNTERQVKNVKAADGLVFDTWNEAAEFVKVANVEKVGVRGEFSTRTMGEQRVYIPVRKAVY